MNLHEAMLDDLNQVFFDLDEFACVHELNGKQIKCIVDDQQGEASTRPAKDFFNPTGLGLLQCDRVVYCQASDLIPQPLPGEKIIMDGTRWLVSDSGVAETEGMLKLPLNRAY